MDVLHITHQFAPETRGGVESYVADVAAAQRRRGADVQVLSGSHEPWPRLGIETLRSKDLPVHRLHRDDLFFDLYTKNWHPGVEQAIGEFLDHHLPRVVHVHQWIRLTTNLVELAHARRIPTVVTLHDYYSSCPRAFRMRPGDSACTRPLSVESCVDCVPRYGHESREERAQGIELFADQFHAELTMAGAVLVAAEATADLLAATTRVPRQRFRILPLGYRPRFAGWTPLPPPEERGTFRFAYWGGVARHKGVTVLLDALRRLVESGLPRPVELHVLGGFATPDFEQELRARAEGLPVRLHGAFETEQIPQVQPHVGVFPSTCLETFGIVLDECFELGLPCIVADHGALGSRAGGGGLRVRPGDVVELAAAMRRLLAEPGLWQELRHALPQGTPGIEEHCDALDEIYREAAAAGSNVAAGLPAARRVAFLVRQRESALARAEPQDRGH